MSRKEALADLQGQVNCQLKELSQFQCGLYKNEIICVPFKRIFKQCASHDGKPTLYEITTADVNVGQGPQSPQGFTDIKDSILGLGK